MKLLCMTITAALTGQAASAHGGAHLHPHGLDTAIMALMAASLAVIAIAVARK